MLEKALKLQVGPSVFPETPISPLTMAQGAPPNASSQIAAGVTRGVQRKSDTTPTTSVGKASGELSPALTGCGGHRKTSYKRNC